MASRNGAKKAATQPPVPKPDEPSPDEVPDIPRPTRGFNDDSSFLLQTVCDLNKAVGRLDAKIDNIGDGLKSIKDEVKTVREKVENLRLVLAWGAGGVVTIVFIVAVFFKFISVPQFVLTPTQPVLTHTSDSDKH
jgi:hypothetical protein